MRAECWGVVKMGAPVLELMDSLQRAQGKVERLPDTWLEQDQKVLEGIQGCNTPVSGGAGAGENGELGEGGRPCSCERKGTREER